MKRLINIILVFLLLVSVTGCKGDNHQNDYSYQTDEVVQTTEPIDVIANENASILKTSNSEYTICFEVIGNKLKISGALNNDFQKYLMVIFNKNDESKNNFAVTNRSFSSEMELPDEEKVAVELYAGKEEYGSYSSLIIDFVNLEKVNNTWCFVESDVYDNNKMLFDSAKNPQDYLSATSQIQSDDAAIVKLAEDITNGITDDYEKVRAVHDWVAANIYYDFDSLSTGNYDNMDAKSVLVSQKGVCEGYANVMAALLRSQNIPCRIQGGYALGIGVEKEWSSSNINIETSNHAWNEVYVNGRWIIIDSTWDSPNEYRDGSYISGEFVTDIYFDSTLEFFSLSHKSID